MYKYFVGIDISKETIDFAVLHGNNFLKSYHITNTEESIKELIFTLKATFNCTTKNTLYCAEHMGIFATYLLKIATEKKLNICMESPLRIKLSMGIERGKSDEWDAKRIAEYAFKNQTKILLWSPVRYCINELSNLSTLRSRLVKMKVMLINPKKLESYYFNKKQIKAQTAFYERTLTAIKCDISAIEQRMLQCIKKDDNLFRLYEIITSIPQLSTIISVEILVATNEFKNITCPKKFASYCGIAPFEWSSGKSIKGRTRVSHIATNKDIKKLLHLASMGYVRNKDSFLGRYYLRKVEEGKNKMSILNAIRNKIVQRIFACVKNNEIFKEQK